jgi:hypothetical protein
MPVEDWRNEGAVVSDLDLLPILKPWFDELGPGLTEVDADSFWDQGL